MFRLWSRERSMPVVPDGDLESLDPSLDEKKR